MLCVDELPINSNLRSGSEHITVTNEKSNSLNDVIYNSIFSANGAHIPLIIKNRVVISNIVIIE